MIKLIRKRKNVHLTVDRKVWIQAKDVDAKTLEALKNRFVFKNPNYYFESKYNALADEWIITYEMTRDSIGLSRGAIDDIIAILKKHKYNPIIIDETVVCDPVNYRHKIKLEQHQKKIDKAFDQYREFLLRAPTGAGKTEMALYLIAQLQQPALIVVPTAALLKEWRMRISDTFGMPLSDIGVLGDGNKPSVTKITVGIKDSIYKRLDMLVGKFGIVVCDEAYSFGAKTYNAVADAFNARYRLALSAWEKRKDKKEFLIYDQFSKNAITISMEEAQAAGRVLPIFVELVPSTLEFDNRLSATALRSALADHEGRCLFIARIVKDLIASGEKVVVFSERNNVLRIIKKEMARNGVECFLLIGKVNVDNSSYAQIKKAVSDNKPIVILTNRVGFAGVDLPALTVAVSTAPVFQRHGGSIENDGAVAIQQAGRVRRAYPGKTCGRYIYIWDRKIFPHDNLHFAKLFGHSQVSVWSKQEITAINKVKIKWSPNRMD